LGTALLKAYKRPAGDNTKPASKTKAQELKEAFLASSRPAKAKAKLHSLETHSRKNKTKNKGGRSAGKQIHKQRKDKF
jgi:hypothetical protein